MSPTTPNVIASFDVGPHHVCLELPDIVHVHYHEIVEVEHFKAMDNFIANIPEPPELYLLRDARMGGLTTAEARAYMARHGHLRRLRAIITYGATFRAQTLMALATKAHRNLNHYGPEIVFCDTEDKARNWIAAHRKRATSSTPADTLDKAI